MHRPGIDPENVRMEDVLCDFCAAPWAEGVPLVEGHRGAVVCGTCLTNAYRALVLESRGTASPGEDCRLCLERRNEIMWLGATGASACLRCVRQSAGVLAKDPDYGWKRPV